MLPFNLKILVASAADYQTLVPIQGFIPASIGNDLTGYLNGLFKLGIAVATGLAVIMVIIGGIQYMSTDAVGDKTEGREKIISALWGLLLALASWMILNTINPQLVTGRLTIAPVNSTTTPIPSNIGGPLGLDPNGFLPPEPGAPNGVAPSGPLGPGGVVGPSGGPNGINDYYTDPTGTTYIDYNNGYTAIIDQNTGYSYVLDQNDNVVEGLRIDGTNVAIDTDGRTNPGIDPITHQSATSYAPNGQYLDATTDDYVAIPQSSGIPLGTTVLITNNNFDPPRQVWAVVGDYGAVTYGEMSLHAAQAIGEAVPGRDATFHATGVTFTFYGGGHH